MKHGIGRWSGVGAKVLVASLVPLVAFAACDDSGDRVTPRHPHAGSPSHAGSSGSGGKSATPLGGAGGDDSPVAGKAGAPVGGTSVGGTSAGESAVGGAGAGGTDAGSGGEGGQAGAASDSLVVFGDDYAAGVGFVAFGGSVNDVTVDATTSHAGGASLKIAVPAAGYTGGALVSATDQDLSKYNAVSFWAKASVANALNVVGLGNDAAAGSPLPVERSALGLTAAWQHFVVPVPAPSKLTAENGLFHFAEGAESAAYTIWLDDIEYVSQDDLGAPAPAIATETRNITIGSTFAVPGTAVGYTLDGTLVTFSVGPAWFDYTSQSAAIASVSAGVVKGEGVGSSEVTAKLGAVAATGKITVNVAEVTEPLAAAPTPANLPADVISLFSDAFTNVPVDTWSASWDVADLAEVMVAGNATKLYTNLSYVGVEFTTTPVDATSMTHLHVDVWLPAATSFTVKLVDFGANGAYGGGDDSEFPVSKTALTTKSWQPLEFALSDFTGLAARAHLAQMILTSDANATVYVDNFYFHK